MNSGTPVEVNHEPAGAVGALFSKIIKGRSGLGAKRWLLALALFILIELAVLAGVYDRLEMSLYDAWFRLQGVQNPGEQIVVIAIDDASLKHIGDQYGAVWPWPRSIYVPVLEKIKAAKVAGFDIVFGVPTTPEEDIALANGITEHGRVVLAGLFAFQKNEKRENEEVYIEPPPQLGQIGVGYANMPSDRDGVVRQFTAADTNFADGPYYPFSLVTAMAAMNLNPGQVKITPGCLQIGDRKIPINGLNQAMPSWWGPQGTFKTYSFADVLEGKIPDSVFKDKIVLLGPTAPVLHDVLPTPYTTSNLFLSGSPPSPGVEIHASVIKSFLENRWYRKVNPAVNFGFLFLAGMLTTALVSGRGPARGLIGALALIAGVAAVTFGLWRYGRLWLNMGAPIALIFVNYAVTTAAEFVQAEMGRRRTRAMFSRYVSPAVADELMRDPDRVALGGRRMDVTIMFCDIRGFTSYSENKDPEVVVSRLNEYLTVLTHVIFKHGGTLDKYLGDGLMAIFGAPVHYSDHIQRAIQASVEIQREIDKLNEAWAANNQPPLRVGVGINSGTVLVGNVGSPERMDYTVIGENVNLASRVEGLTKTFDTLITISERTVKMLEQPERFPWELRYLGEAEVKGFSVPIGVYTAVERGC